MRSTCHSTGARNIHDDSNSVATFVVVTIDHAVMDFHTPMLSGADEISLGIGLVRRAADESAGDFTAEFADLSVNGLPLDHEHLADMREVGAVVQFVRCRNVVRLNVAANPLSDLRKAGRLAAPTVEVELNVLAQRRHLISLDGEMIMHLALLNPDIEAARYNRSRISSNYVVSKV